MSRIPISNNIAPTDSHLKGAMISENADQKGTVACVADLLNMIAMAVSLVSKLEMAPSCVLSLAEQVTSWKGRKPGRFGGLK